MESDGEKVVGRIERRYACDVSGLRERNRHRVVAAQRSEVDPARPRHMDERAPPACDFPGDGGVTAGERDRSDAAAVTYARRRIPRRHAQVLYRPIRRDDAHLERVAVVDGVAVPGVEHREPIGRDDADPPREREDVRGLARARIMDGIDALVRRTVDLSLPEEEDAAVVIDAQGLTRGPGGEIDRAVRRPVAARTRKLRRRRRRSGRRSRRRRRRRVGLLTGGRQGAAGWRRRPVGRTASDQAGEQQWRERI